MYIPHIATVIHEQNQLISNGKQPHIPGARLVNMKALMVSNPISVSFVEYMVIGPNLYYFNPGLPLAVPLGPSAKMLLYRPVQCFDVSRFVREAPILPRSYSASV